MIIFPKYFLGLMTAVDSLADLLALTTPWVHWYNTHTSSDTGTSSDSLNIRVKFLYFSNTVNCISPKLLTVFLLGVFTAM